MRNWIVAGGVLGIGNVPDKGAIRTYLRDFLCQVAVRINQTKRVTLAQILGYKIVKSCGFTGSRLPDDVNVLKPIGQANTQGSPSVTPIRDSDSSDVTEGNFHCLKFVALRAIQKARRTSSNTPALQANAKGLHGNGCRALHGSLFNKYCYVA